MFAMSEGRSLAAALGSLMVSSEGACAAVYSYGRIDLADILKRREAAAAANVTADAADSAEAGRKQPA